MSRAKLQETRVADLLVVSLVLRTEGDYSFFRGGVRLCVRKVGLREMEEGGKRGLAKRNKMKWRKKRRNWKKITEGGRKCI